MNDSQIVAFNSPSLENTTPTQILVWRDSSRERARFYLAARDLGYQGDMKTLWHTLDCPQALPSSEMHLWNEPYWGSRALINTQSGLDLFSVVRIPNLMGIMLYVLLCCVDVYKTTVDTSESSF